MIAIACKSLVDFKCSRSIGWWLQLSLLVMKLKGSGRMNSEFGLVRWLFRI